VSEPAAPEPGVPDLAAPEPGVPDLAAPEPGVPDLAAPEPGVSQPAGRPDPARAGSAGLTPQPPPVPVDPAPGGPPRLAEPAPSWGKVLATTLLLWLQRRSARALWLATAAVALVVFAAGALTVLLAGHPAGPAAGRTGRGSAHHQSASGGAALAAAATARRQAAAWVATQVSRSSVVACDPVMCAALQAQGVPAASLLELSPSADGPLGSAVVVATAALRSQFGARLTTVYAPTVLAAFGAGTARVEVRVTAPDGAPAYLASLSSDLHERMALGAQLLRSSSFIATNTARAQLTAGQVDARLLITLVTLAAIQHVDVLGFGDAGPGSSYGVPLRAAELAGLQQARGGELGYLNSALAFFLAQRSPFLAAAGLQRASGGQLTLHIEFAAPSPLGLFSGHYQARQ